jgi:ammonium transporter, Amt family
MSNIGIKQIAPFTVLLLVTFMALFIEPEKDFIPDEGVYNAADMTWLMVCCALVYLMTPGLAFFYGGMVHRKNVISTMIKSVVAAGVIGVLWVTFGFSLAFGESVGGVFGDPTTFAFFKNVRSSGPWSLAPTIPLTLFAMFQLMFAIITPGLVVGAVAERVRFTSYILFIVLFIIFIYCPVAHWSWHPNGILAKMGVWDFAGGTVVHITAGCAALAGALVLKPRIAYMEHKEVPPANVPYVLIGTGLLWFGWFGFNGGSALGAGTLAVQAMMTTNTAAAAGGLGWMFFDVVKGKKPSVIGFCIGAVVGLVAITPSCGYVGVPQSIFIGVFASIVSNIAVALKQRSSLDDTLDVFPCHGVGGIVGMILTGVFANADIHGIKDGPVGLLYGNPTFFFVQLKAAVIVSLFAFGVSFAIFKLISLLMTLRVTETEEEEGLDASQHDEKYLQGTVLVAPNE